MSRWNDKSLDHREWTNAKLMNEFEQQLAFAIAGEKHRTNLFYVDQLRDEIRRRFIRNPKRR